MVVIAVIRSFLLGVLVTFGVASTAWAQRTVPFLIYNDYAPLIIDAKERTGLAYAVAELLTRRSQGEYFFEVAVLPRKRLDVELTSERVVAVPFVAPTFFDDEEMTRFDWTDTLFPDSQIILVSPLRAFPFHGPESLAGRSLGGILGHRYLPLEAAVAAGRIRREDVASDEMNLAKLSAGRVDAVSISSLSFGWLRGRDTRFAALEKAGTLYPIDRRILIHKAPGSGALREFMNAAIADANAVDWRAVYGTHAAR